MYSQTTKEDNKQMKKKIIVAIFATCMLATACGKAEVQTQAEVEETETMQESKTTEISQSETVQTKLETDSTWDTKEVLVGIDIVSKEFDKANHNLMPEIYVNMPLLCEPTNIENGIYNFNNIIDNTAIGVFNFSTQYCLEQEEATGFGRDNVESTKEEYNRYILTTTGTKYGIEINIYDTQTTCTLIIRMSYNINNSDIDERDEYLKLVEDNLTLIKKQVSEWPQDFVASDEPLETTTTDEQAVEIDLSQDEWVQNYIDAFYTTYYGECGKLELIYVDGNGNDKVIATDTDNNLTWECQLIPIGDDAWQAVYNGEAIFDFAINMDGTLDVDTPFEEYAAIYGTFTKQ